MSGDAWRYAPNLSEPKAAGELLQAALQALATIRFARTKVNPDEFGTVPDWGKVERDLAAAMAAVGHPAGDV
jgi:hypothetical protein